MGVGTQSRWLGQEEILSFQQPHFLLASNLWGGATLMMRNASLMNPFGKGATPKRGSPSPQLVWCHGKGVAGIPPPSQAQLPFEHTDHGRGCEPKTKCFCVQGIMFCWKNMHFTPSGPFGTVCHFGSREVWDTSREYMQTRKGLLHWDVDHTY